MSSGNGVIAAKALEVLATLGFDWDKVAAEVGCHRRTVARWEVGQYQPSKRNRAALRRWIGDLLTAENAAASNARSVARINRLNLAAEALTTDAEKAERVRFEQEMRDRYAAIVAERQPRKSAFADLSPFRVFGQEAQELAAVEAVFG